MTLAILIVIVTGTAPAGITIETSSTLVIAAGGCACTGGEFGVSYACCGAVENVIPVDAKIPGCPPTPLALLQGLLGAMLPSDRKDHIARSGLPQRARGR